MMRRRLYLRLYFSFLGVLLVITIATAIVNFFSGRSVFGVLRGGPHMAQHIARMLHADGLQGQLDQLHDELAVDLEVVDANGAVVAQAGPPVTFLPERLAVARRSAGWLRQGVVVAPVRSMPGAVVLVRIPLPGAAILRPILVLIGVLLLAFALVYPLSRSITRPIEQLTTVVEAYGRGDLKQRSGLGDLQDEVGQLARSFDEMAGRIEAARRSEKELLANVSHELRTPLARIKVALELIDIRDEPTRRRVAAISEEVDELDRLVGDVLTAARLEVASLPLKRTRLNAKDLADKARSRALALEPTLAVDVRAEPQLALDADEGLLSRALDNLLDNARKYGRGPVDIEAARDGEQAVLAVRDRGAGIPPDELTKVFDPFFRGSSTRGSSSGFGLGLALVKRVAEAHGGTAQVINAAGGGARIELRLPIAV